MNSVTVKYPVDILLCLGVSAILLPVEIFNINGTLRILLGLPFILFIPGYLLLLCIFPRTEFDSAYKIGISIGLSISLTPLIGILLFYSPIGLNLTSILWSVFLIIVLCGMVALSRRRRLPRPKQITLHFPNFRSKSPADQFLLVILLSSAMVVVGTIAFISFFPHSQEASTEFYVLGSTGKTTAYPQDLAIGQNSNVTLGLINLEHKTIDYTIEIWLVNQTISYNNGTQSSEPIFHDMWFLDKITVKLKSFTKSQELIWQPQWEYSYNFSLNKTGHLALMFLLYTVPTSQYSRTQNYEDISQIKIKNAYESTYLWVDVHE